MEMIALAITGILSAIALAYTHKHGEINETGMSNHDAQIIKWEAQFETKYPVKVVA